MGTNDPKFDLASDGQLDQADVDFVVREAFQSSYGDATLDGVFDSTDLVRVFQEGLYEQDLAAGWAAGDWNGDGRFDSSDLVLAMQTGGYVGAALGVRLSATRVSRQDIVMNAVVDVGHGYSAARIVDRQLSLARWQAAYPT